MFNVGGAEVLVILLVALLVLGPDKLPDAARTAGKMMRQVRDLSQGFQAEVRSAMDDVQGKERPATGDVHPGAGAGPSLPPASTAPAAPAATSASTSDPSPTAAGTPANGSMPANASTPANAPAPAGPTTSTTPPTPPRPTTEGASWSTDGPSSSFS